MNLFILWDTGLAPFKELFILAVHNLYVTFNIHIKDYSPVLDQISVEYNNYCVVLKVIFFIAVLQIKENYFYYVSILLYYVAMFSSNTIFCLLGRYVVSLLKSSLMSNRFCKNYRYVIFYTFSFNLKILSFKNIANDLNKLKKSLLSTLHDSFYL